MLNFTHYKINIDTALPADGEHEILAEFLSRVRMKEEEEEEEKRLPFAPSGWWIRHLSVPIQ